MSIWISLGIKKNICDNMNENGAYNICTITNKGRMQVEPFLFIRFNRPAVDQLSIGLGRMPGTRTMWQLRERRWNKTMSKPTSTSKKILAISCNQRFPFLYFLASPHFKNNLWFIYQTFNHLFSLSLIAYAFIWFCANPYTQSTNDFL